MLPKSCAERLRIIGTAVRLEVLRQLATGPKFVYELNDRLGVEQSLLSHHLRVLRRYGFVAAHREGKAVRYRLARGTTTEGRIDLGCCELSFK
jgi:DNA-binding transcriptional ArsR family regulator